MSRFFNQSSSGQNGKQPTLGSIGEQKVEQLLEAVRSTEEQQVVAVTTTASPALEQLGMQEIQRVLGDQHCRPAIAVSAASEAGAVHADNTLPSVAATRRSEFRLEACPKITIPRTPLLVGNGDERFEIAAEAYRVASGRILQFAKRGFRSIVITSAAQGDGKTITSANLGLTCGNLSTSRLLLVDADLRTKGISRLLGSPPSHGLADVLHGTSSLEQVILATDLANVFLLPAGDTATPSAELFTGARWRDLIGCVSELFDLVLVDSPPVLPLADFELISAGCAGVLCVVRAFSTERELMLKMKSQIEPKKHLGVILNCATTMANGYYNYYPRNTASISKRQNKGSKLHKLLGRL